MVVSISFGETQSTGHALYFMDYRAVDENGESCIVLIDNEMNNAVTVVAKNLEEFLMNILITFGTCVSVRDYWYSKSVALRKRNIHDLSHMINAATAL